MIQVKYASLFEVVFLHDYYKDELCRDIIVTPSPACQQTLRQLGWRIVNTDTGCKVFGKVTEVNNVDFLNIPVPENTRLVFLLQLRNRSFGTFTQLSLSKKQDEYFYFNNLVTNLGQGNTPLLVANAGSKKVSDSDLLRFERNSYRRSHTSNALTHTGEVRFTDNGELFSQKLDNNKDQFNFSLDLREATGGRASFFLDGNKQDDFYLEDSGVGTDCFGVIEIFHRAALPDTYRFVNSNRSVATKKYQIRFANRQTKWRYVVTRKFNIQVDEVKIKKTNGGGIDFTAQGGTPVGQFILTSNTPVPLKEEPVTGIRMSDQNNKELMAHLPNPSLSVLKQEGNELFSDIFITI
jgi:hypothetical protein